MGAGSRRGWKVVLLGFALWPLAHLWLVRTQHINPWKCMGWAMYTTVPPRSYVVIDEIRADGVREAPGVPAAVMPAYLEFANGRAAIGRLADPSALAHAYLDAVPEVDGVIVEAHVWALDPTSSRIATTQVDRFRLMRER